MIHFVQPIWLTAGLLSCVALIVFFGYRAKKRDQRLQQFASIHLLAELTQSVSVQKRHTRQILLILAVFCCFAALARPQYGYKWEDVKRKGIDLLFAIDTSRSMLAEDIKPNRLTRAHLAILDFVRQLEGDRVGLMPFAGSAYLMCPLTLDYSAFEQSLVAVSTDLIPKGGTNLEEVIELAAETLKDSANHKILIILTDGENLQGDVLDAASKQAEKGLTIYTLGVGTAQGELIPLGGGRDGFVKDGQGKFVTSKLDQKTLTEIAAISGGIYSPLQGNGAGLDKIYQEKLSLIPKQDLAERRHKVGLDRFEWPLGLALFFLIAEFLVGEKKNGSSPFTLNGLKKIKIPRLSPGKNELSILFLCLLLTCSAGKAFSSRGEDAFAAQDYLGASDYYLQRLENKPEDPELNYNFGTTAFKNNMLDDAIASFGKALKSTKVDLQEKSYYNLGISHYQKGKEMLQADPSKAANHWQEALDSLDGAIQLATDKEKPQRVRDIALKQLEELQKQLEQQKQENQDQKQDKQQEGQKQSEQQQEKEQNQQGSKSSGNQERSEHKQDQQEDTEDSMEDQPAPASSENSEDPEKQQKPSQAEEEKSKREQEEKKAAAMARREQGKMTSEEAEQLLNTLKNEEEELNFVPAPGRFEESEPKRDW